MSRAVWVLPLVLVSVIGGIVLSVRAVRPESGGLQTALPCESWAEPVAVGSLDPSLIDEASGLENPDSAPDILYHINDSGDSGRFFITGRDGSGTVAVAVEGFVPRDIEDLTWGPCGMGEGDCLFLADIGDNQSARPDIEVVVVAEERPFPGVVRPRHRFRFTYPEGPRDAESLALHPNGDLFILTKMPEYTRLAAGPSELYRLPYSVWTLQEAGVHVAERVGEIDLAAISSDAFSGSLPTAMDIRADGERFLVLTYQRAFEFYVDLSRSRLKPADTMVAGVDFQEIEITPLGQQESIAYRATGDGFFYTSEGSEPRNLPIMYVECP